ncbi:MAG: hypothetical protein JWP74_3479 [Marmoricola sp.]|nr:hypothetical protein [Marmoricola sp.]
MSKPHLTPAEKIKSVATKCQNDNVNMDLFAGTLKIHEDISQQVGASDGLNTADVAMAPYNAVKCILIGLNISGAEDRGAWFADNANIAMDDVTAEQPSHITLNGFDFTTVAHANGGFEFSVAPASN